MPQTPLPTAPYAIGAALIDPAAHTATVAGRTVRLEPRMVRVLGVLAGAGGGVVTREALLGLWDQAYPSDEALTQIISKLRRALQGAGSDPIIETVPKAGYRLTCPVNLAPGPMPGALWADAGLAWLRGPRTRLALGAAAIALAMLAGALLFAPREPDPEYTIEDFDPDPATGPGDASDPNP